MDDLHTFFDARIHTVERNDILGIVITDLLLDTKVYVYYF